MAVPGSEFSPPTLCPGSIEKKCGG